MLSWRHLRWTMTLALTALLAGSLALQHDLDRTDGISTAPQVAVHERGIPLVATAPTPSASDGPVRGDPQPAPEQQAALVAELKPTIVKPFSLLGVTWKSGLPDDAVIEVKSRTGGKWTSWSAIDLDLENTATEGGRPGTEPQWVGASDGVAVRIISSTRQAPRDLQLATIDPGNTTALTPVAFRTGVTAPSIILRSTWGADNSGKCDSPIYGSTTRGAVVHHTAGSNSYSAAESANIVRATQAYHMTGRDWCDIGYNFLVDKYGQIFEGRKGGIDKPVRAAHSGNGSVNEETMGVSMMGTFSSTEPTTAMKAAVVKLIAWRFDQVGIPANGTYSLGGLTLNRISGHRNVVSTECPGAKAYAWLTSTSSTGLRQQAAEAMASGAGAEPAGPTGVAVTDKTMSSLSVDWATVSGAEGYKLKLSKSSSWTDPIYFDFTDSEGTATGLTPGTKYYVKVSMTDSNGTRSSAYSAKPYATAYTSAATPPTKVAVTGTASTSMSVDWTAVSGAEGYKVKLSKSLSWTDPMYFDFTDAKGTVSGLESSTKYYVKVAVIDPLSGSRISSYSSKPYVSGSTTAKSATTPPTNVAVTGATASSLSVDWSDVAGAEGYQLKVSDSSSWTDPMYFDSNNSNGTATGLEPNTKYYVKVSLTDAEGSRSTPYSSKPYASGSTSAVPTSPPTKVVATPASSTSVSVDWTGVAGAEGYRVKLSKSSAWTSPMYFDFTEAKGTVTGLASGTKYYVKVSLMDPKSGSRTSSYSAKPYTTVSTSSGSTASDKVTVSSTRNISVKGHGYGHGIGMSQYGAQGAARSGEKYPAILSRYYPGTSLSTKSGDIRVLISADTTDSVLVNGESGLKLHDVSGNRTISLPTTVSGKAVVRWRIIRTQGSATRSKLQYRTTGSYTTYQYQGSGLAWAGDGEFTGPTTIGLVLPNGSTMHLRGDVRSAKPSSGSGSRNTVNVLSIENYVRGVIAAEMPSSWHTEALKAQAVAARTYGVRSMSSSRYYDICSTTACQVYGGQSRETADTDTAVAGTAGKILTYQGTPAFTQFSSSSGGFTNVGSQPYLKAVSDPWDDWSGNANHDWTITVKASTIEKAYSTIGTLKSIQVTKRNGYGDMGGRVSSLKLVGSKATKTITGTDARWAFGLRSDWFGF